MTRIAVRPCSQRVADMLTQEGLHPVLARIFAARGITSTGELSTDFSALLPPFSLLNIDRAAFLLADAIRNNSKICIVADYDCDGATACAVAMRGLEMMGGRVSFFVPNRFDNGYGLTPAVVNEVCELYAPDMLVTVDNGIASLDGVMEAINQGMQVLVTDHHLPGDQLPSGCVIVNPNQADDCSGANNLAGVGVIFYVLLGLRAELRKRGVFDEKTQPRLDKLLDLVALGTVTDVVRLDRNNRILVSQGLKRIHAGCLQPGVAALFRASGREWQKATTQDLGFAVGPRLNAAGRISDMSLGVELLVTDDAGYAWEMAQELNRINQERREKEMAMRVEAREMLKDFVPAERASVVVLDEKWHQGVIGIVASRIKDAFYRPAVVFSLDKNGLIKGAGRSIPGFHLRDAFDLISKRHPGMIERFGGHAMAAGLSIRADAFDAFCEAFEDIARTGISKLQLERIIETDGAPDSSCYTLDFVRLLDSQVWGQGFEPPVFSDVFKVTNQRILNNRHLNLSLQKNGKSLNAIYFNRAEMFSGDICAAFRITANEHHGFTAVQLVIEYAEAA